MTYDIEALTSSVMDKYCTHTSMFAAKYSFPPLFQPVEIMILLWECDFLVTRPRFKGPESTPSFQQYVGICELCAVLLMIMLMLLVCT